MGAWGIKNFQNDSALDWVNLFQENLTMDFIISTFSDVISSDFLEVDEASAILAAGEVLAAIKGRPSHAVARVPRVTNIL